MEKLLTVLLCLAIAVTAVAGTHLETFNTTTFRDTPLTTADWDLSTGTLHLPSQQMAYLGGVNLYGVTHVEAAGALAVVERGGSGVDIFDLAHPASPVLVGSITDSGFPVMVVSDVALAGTVLYMAWSRYVSFFPPVVHSGIAVYSLAVPSLPVFVQSVATTAIVALARHGNVLCGVGEAGLTVWDITDPVLPTVVGSVGLSGSLMAVAMQGSAVYVAAGTMGLHVVRLDQLAAPVLVATVPLPGLAQDVAVSGFLVGVAAGSGGAQLVDVTNSLAPLVVGSYTAAWSIVSVAMDGNILAVGAEFGGLTQLDVGDPASPLMVDEVTAAVRVSDLILSGDRIVTAQTDGLGLVRAAAGYLPAHVREAPLDVFYLQHVNGLQAGSRHLYVEANGTIHVYETYPMAPMAEIGTGIGAGDVASFAVDGALCHLAKGGCGTTLEIVDLSDPLAPVSLGAVFAGAVSPVALDTDGRIDSVLMKNTLQAAQVAAVDVSDVSAPVLLGTTTLPIPPVYRGHYGVHREAGVLFVLNDTDGIRIYDAHDPANMTAMGHYQASSSRVIEAMEPVGGVMYVASLDTLTMDSYFDVVSLAVPSNPVSLGSCSLGVQGGGVDNLAVSGTRVTFSSDFTLTTVDVSDPSAPWPVHQLGYGVGQHAEGPVAVSGDFVYLALDRSTQWNIDHVVTEYRLFSRGVNTAANTARSLSVASLASTPLAIRMAPLAIGNIDWSYSLDGGANFVAAAADGTWEPVFPTHGPTLRWQAVLNTVAGTPAPSCDAVALAWRGAEPAIASLADVAADQGGALTLTFASSGAELVNGYGGLTYTVYRRGGTASWDSVATVPAVMGTESHVVVVPTVRDSTLWAGPQPTVFKVRAWGAPVGEFTDSAPDSAYSVDNIAPGPPASVAVAYGATPWNSVRWTAAPDADVFMYRVHRGPVAGFPTGPATVVDSLYATSSPLVWVDLNHGGHAEHYAVTALDVAGNESPAQHAVIASDVPTAQTPAHWLLARNSPNPFNPLTKIVYGAPAGGGRVEMAVYDLSGRRVRTLVSGQVPAGRHEVVWDGTDGSGRVVASGVYLVRLQTPAGVLVRKMTLVE